MRVGPVDALLADTALLSAARLGPAWAPAVHRLLAGTGATARPCTADELPRALVDEPVADPARADFAGPPDPGEWHDGCPEVVRCPSQSVRSPC